MPAKKTTKAAVNYSELTRDDKLKALDSALANIEKSFGKGAVMKFGEKKIDEDIKVTPTGNLSIDMALGIGGIPSGRIIEIYGPESSGKTTLTLHVVAEMQKRGGIAAFIDAEHALDPVYARKLGVDVDNLYISQPDDGEQALEIAESMVRSGAIDIVIIDSVAALVPRAEISGEMGDSHMGLQARLMSQALRKLTSVIHKTGATVIFINQLRAQIGGMSYGGPAETTTGGKALKFYASIRIDIRRIGSVKAGEEVIGNRTKVKIAKNKLAPPFKVVEFDIMFGQGMSKEGSLIDLGVDMKLVNKSGSWYSYNGEKLGQGLEKSKEFLKENPEIALEIETKIREHYDIPLTPMPNLEEQKEEEKPKKKAASKKKAKKEEEELTLIEEDEDETGEDTESEPEESEVVLDDDDDNQISIDEDEDIIINFDE